MNYLFAAWRFLTSRAGMIAAAILGALAFIFAARRDAAKDALAKDRAERAEDHIRRTDAGRAAAEAAKRELRAGKKPDDVLRANDGKW